MKLATLNSLSSSYKALLFAFFGFSGIANVSAEVITGTNLSVHFESANIVGSGRNINMNRIPVVDVNTGSTTFYDASFRFTFTPGVGFEFVTISSAAISPPLSTSNLMPGTYVDQFNRTFSLEGPSALSGNRLLYTLKGIGNRFSAQIITGPASGHPDIGEREIVPFLPETFIYGLIADRGNTSSFSADWETNELIGLRQNGNILSVSLFSDGIDNNGNPVDFSTQRDSVTLTKEIE